MLDLLKRLWEAIKPDPNFWGDQADFMDEFIYGDAWRSTKSQPWDDDPLA